MGSGASTNLKKEFLRKSSVFGSLSDEQLTALAKCFVVKTKQKDSFLENIPNIICVGRGELKVYSGSSGGSGARSEMNYLCTKKPGDVLVPFPLSSRRMFRTVTLSSGFGGEEEEEKAAAAAAAGPAAPLGGARSGTRQSSYLDDQQDPATARRGAAAATTSRARVLCGTDCQLLYLEPGAVRGLAKKAATADLALILGKLGQDLAALAGGLRFLAEAAPPELQLFAELCSYESHAAGAAVLEQGASGDKFYLVLHGGCDVLIATGPPPPSGEEEAEGEGEGEAAAAADADADAGVRPAAPVAHVVERRGSAARARLVATRSGKLSVQPVAKKKEAAAALASPAERPMATVAHLKEGQYFGEMALMVNMPRSCTIRATTDCLFAVMDKRRFRKFLKACPRVRRAMEADMCERLLDQLRALDLPLLAAFPPAKVPPRRLAECCRLHEYGAGDVVVRKGDPVSGAFFTLHGELELVRAKLAPLKRRSYIVADRNGQVKLRRGNSFGEETIRADLPDAPRWAAGLEEGEGGGGGGAAAAAARATAQYTVMALKDTVVLEVTAAAAGLIRGDASLTARFRLCQLREDCGLTHVLEDAAAARHLLAFLRAEHSEEGLEFLRAVRAFRAGCAAAAGDRLTAPAAAAAAVGGGAGAGADAGGGFAPLLAAGDIVRTFVAESAPKQVNIPASQRVEIEQILASTVIKGAGAVTAGLFDAAYEEVRRLVDRDGFARFRRSPSFQNMMDELRKETDDCDATC